MGHPAFRQDQRYNLVDYLSWDNDERWELIDGYPYALAAPGTAHQKVAGRIYSQIESYLENQPCEVFIAPFDVIFDPVHVKDEEKKNVVQPDVTIVCDEKKITSRGCEGVPDMVVEVLSPGTWKRDLNDKFNLYQFSGIKEYWVVSPADASIVVYVRNESGRFQQKGIYNKEDAIQLEVLPNLKIDLKRIFRS